MCRLALRSPKQAAKSSIKKSPTSTIALEDLLKRFSKKASHALLFLKAVTVLEFEVRNDLGETTWKTKLTKTFDDFEAKARVTQLFEVIGSAKFDDLVDSAVEGPAIDATAVIHIKNESIDNGIIPKVAVLFTEKWLIKSRLFVDKNFKTFLKNYAGLIDKKDANYVPFVQIAARYSMRKHEQCTGGLFVGLPLPNYERFPVSISARFALSSDRRTIHMENEVGKAWNELLLGSLLEIFVG